MLCGVDQHVSIHLLYHTKLHGGRLTDRLEPSTTRIFLRGNWRLEARPSMEDRSSPSGSGVNLSKKGAI